MQNKDFIDPYVKTKRRKSNENLQFLKNTNIPLPSEIEISESGTCNRSCVFCPRSDHDYVDKKEFISNYLHNKLCTELSEVEFSGTIRYSGFVEPLLDKNIFNLINSVRNIVPKSNIEMVTNGDVLNESRLMKLFDNGLNTLLISIYDGPEDVEKMEKLKVKCNLNDEQFFIRHRYLPPEEIFGLTLSNRSGMLENAEFKVRGLSKPLKHLCNYPSYTLFIDYLGDVLMCPHDWGKKMILGNLNHKRLMDIWCSKFAIENRLRLINGNRNGQPCNKCDVKGHLIGDKHAKAWIKNSEQSKQ